jgi:oxygen-independent coproporphyrinogen-3 oxidase
MDSLSVYLHVPFCTTKCTYCAFNTYTHLEHLVPDFLHALCAEISYVGQRSPQQEVGTVYLGGGTPSLLTPAQIDQIMRSLSDNFVLAAGCEITVEANPNDLDATYSSALRAIGVGRLSIGMQSADAQELALFARRHDVEGVQVAVDAARTGGFDNINLDLIYGVPHQTLETWRHSVRQAIALEPTHISLYALGIEDGTPMQHWVRRGSVAAPDDDLAADMYDLACDVMAAASYEQYEISNWAKPGFACQHNLQYWRNLPYAGLGPGAHGFAGGYRYATVRSPRRYIESLSTDDRNLPYPLTPAVAEYDLLDQRATIVETLITGLRLTREGILRATFRNRFGMDVLSEYGDTLEKFESAGLVEISPDRVRLTDRARLLSNLVFRELV